MANSGFEMSFLQKINEVLSIQSELTSLYEKLNLMEEIVKDLKNTSSTHADLELVKHN